MSPRSLSQSTPRSQPDDSISSSLGFLKPASGASKLLNKSTLGSPRDETTDKTTSDSRSENIQMDINDLVPVVQSQPVLPAVTRSRSNSLESSGERFLKKKQKPTGTTGGGLPLEQNL